jgi:hypothetical protein
MLRSLAVLSFAVQALAAPVTVPLIVEGNAPMIDLDFAGADGKTHRGRFLVDSGGGAFMIGQRLATEIGLKPSAPARRGGRFRTALAPAVRVAGMPLDLKGIRIVLMVGQDRLGARDAADGLIPGTVLQRFDVVFDYPGRTFTLAPPGSVPHRGVAIPAAVKRANGFPRIELTVGVRAYGFLLDTGASYTMISRTVLEEWSAAGWPRHTGASGFANMIGGKMENEALMTRIPEMRAGELVLSGVGAVSRPEGTFEKGMSPIMTAPIVGSIAGNVLRDFRLEIDYRAETVYFERTAVGDPNDMDTVGVTWGGEPSGTMVVTAATDPQLHAGDRLIAVEGAPAVGKSFSQVNALLRGKPGDRKKLEVERAGKRIAVEAAVTRLM